ncbi:conserved hypothetical protein [Ricinus communis]|uniref:Uncharacterized protein n=1 Tax=Ricinus communis TaxID=3988 RepID=B9T8I9_RICCO|nr:conserved hypothetical protein [Ricinus communis]
MGGLGKTTITQKIFNNKQVVDRFEKRIWVSISQTFNEEEIMKTMLKQLGEDVNGLDMAQMLPKIKQALENRNYLIVMDDVWSAEGWWDNICAGLPKREGKSSGIIITTRIENLATEMGVEKARIHQPRILNEEESWALFSRIAFALDAEAQQHSDLEEVGKDSEKMWRLTEIKKLNVQKFGEGYLTISRMCWPQESENSIMASLQLSYDELPIRLKQCLLCFSMYPEDSEIWAEQLARWWVGEGFIEGKGTRTAMEMAFDYISELISRCLVEAVQQRGYDGRVYSCKMHDLVRDLTIKIAKEQISKTNKQKIKAPGIAGCNNLQKLPVSIIALQKLTVLDIGYCPIQQIPQGIGRLSNLQELSGFKVAGAANKNACRLRELQSLLQLRLLRIDICEESEIAEEELPVLLHLKQLKVLSINTEGCEKDEIFQKLDRLPLLHILKNCISARLNIEWEMVQRAMPQIKYVEVSHCYMLNSFPCNIDKLGIWRK